MSTPDTTGPQPPADTPTPYAAVIAQPSKHGGWTGRYLQQAPGPADTARLLRQIVTTRYRGTRPRSAHAAADLLDAHPGGWANLGPGPGKRFTAASALGRCLCHEADGTMVPAMAAAALATVLLAEQSWDRKPVRVPHPASQGDGSPWLLANNGDRPEDVAHVFVLHSDGLEILARDASRPYHFARAALVPWSGKVDWDLVDQAAGAIRARTTADREAELTASVLQCAARSLATVREDLDLVGLHIVEAARSDYRASRIAPALSALARHAKVPDQNLRLHLAGLERADQVHLLQEAANALVRGIHPAP